MAVYDALSSRLLSQFFGHSDLVTGVCFSSTPAPISSPPAAAAAAAAAASSSSANASAASQSSNRGIRSGEEEVLVLSVGRDGRALVWSARRGELLRSIITGYPWWLTSCAWNAHTTTIHDHQPLLAAVGTANNLVFIVNPHAGTVLHTLERHSGPISSLAFLSHLALVSGSEDGFVCLWTTTTMGKSSPHLNGTSSEVVAKVHAKAPVNCVCASVDGTYLAVASDSSTCDVWQVHPATARLACLYKLTGHKSEIWGCAFSSSAMGDPSLELVTVGADRVCLIFAMKVNPYQDPTLTLPLTLL